MNITISTKPWDRKIYSFNFFDLDETDPRKVHLSKYFIGKTKPDPALVKTQKVFKRKR